VSLFIFIFLANILSLVPFFDEPTKDLNTTLALGIVSFLYIQYHAIQQKGLWLYCKEYFEPFFVMLPLNIVGKFATIISISFRLFGNIFGGAIITQLYTTSLFGSLLLETFSLVMGVNIVITLFFGLFEGFLQASVFTMLTLTYLSLELQTEQQEEVP
ncbi:MAG: FoF1 ATP synthase subunit a, partial [Candidatus Babeliales bacterium]